MFWRKKRKKKVDSKTYYATFSTGITIYPVKVYREKLRSIQIMQRTGSRFDEKLIWVSKRSKTYNYFKTYNEALRYLILRTESEIKYARRGIIKLSSELAQVKNELAIEKRKPK